MQALARDVAALAALGLFATTVVLWVDILSRAGG